NQFVLSCVARKWATLTKSGPRGPCPGQVDRNWATLTKSGPSGPFVGHSWRNIGRPAAHRQAHRHTHRHAHRHDPLQSPRHTNPLPTATSVVGVAGTSTSISCSESSLT